MMLIDLLVRLGACRKARSFFILLHSALIRTTCNLFHPLSPPIFSHCAQQVRHSCIHVCILLHKHVEYSALFIHIFDETHFALADNAAGFHAVTACHLFVHIHQFVSFAEIDADLRMPYHHFHFASLRVPSVSKRYRSSRQSSWALCTDCLLCRSFPTVQ